MPSPAFTVRATTSASREFSGLPQSIQTRFAKVFAMLADDPYRPRPGLDVLKMHGGAYRVHVGRYRGLFAIEQDVVVFFRFGHRSVVYR